MSYIRVIPRDFFNESKLLKCLGQIQLVIHDRTTKLPLAEEFDGAPFNIVQNDNDGRLSCTNYHVYLDGEEIELSIPYNSRDAYPLIGIYRGEEYYLFSEKGEFMPNFGWSKE